MSNGVDYLYERNVIGEVNDMLVGAISAIVLTSLTYFVGYLLKPHYNKIVILAFVSLSLFIIYAISVEALLKPIINRKRYDDMLAGGSLDDFSRWFIRGNGGSSFPSGHTALSGVILFICCLPDIIKGCKLNKMLLYFIGLVYILLMAFARIQIGRHFLSDTIFSTIIMSLGILIILRSKVYKKLVSILIENKYYDSNNLLN